MTDCQKSCRDSAKLTALAIAIALGLVIQTHVVRADDQKIACMEYLIESSESSTLSV